MTKLRPLLLALGVLTAAPSDGAPQTLAPDTAGWNGERALELIGRAQARRAETNADSGLINYQSEARIRVYFYLDREDTGERNLVKTDQLALEVFWQSPDQVKQRIVGWRDEKSLPTNIRYHLDHLTVVQENFGDEIRLGDGDEVRGVPHPAAPGAESFYQYRLADSLTLRLPGAPEPVQVYEVQVRPLNPRAPAFVGAVFVERRRGDLVRMDFTFTGASYVDRYLDYINISLDNGLWQGRYWLPNEQRVEIRRRIPQLDVPAGSVIRANMRIGGYRFNQPLPTLTFAGPAVVAAPRAQREGYEFEEELFAEVEEEGLGPQVELGEIRRRAAQLLREQALRRVSGLQLRLPAVSEVLRFNRAEGAVLAAGVGITPRPGVRLGALGGYAFGADHATGRATLEAAFGATRVELAGNLNRPRDVGVGPAASGALNSLSALFVGEDYRDLFFASGAEVTLRRPLPNAWMGSASLRVEEHRSATRSIERGLVGDDFPPVRRIDDADLALVGSLVLARPVAAEAGAGFGWEIGLGAGKLNGLAIECLGGVCGDSRDGPWLKPRADLTWRRPLGAAELEVTGRAGVAFGDLPRQELYLIGGRGTVPGYGFRAFGGDRFALLDARISALLVRPWLSGRLLGAAGWSDVGDAGRSALELWGARPTGAAKPSVGAGLGLFYDILHLDLYRGLSSGDGWEVVVEARRSFWDFL